VFENLKIAFIGPGAMAEGMIYGLINQGVSQPQAITAAGPRQKRLDELSNCYEIETTLENSKTACQADVVILSVKPQRLEPVIADLSGCIKSDALLLSIIAGVTMDRISTGMKHDKVVRCMPNTPAQIGKGITVWTCTDSVSEKQKEITRSILGSFGDDVYVEEEYYLDMATALSGTGPAYVFLFMEAMVDAGVHMGFPRRIAEKLVAQTVRGSVDYYMEREDPVHLARLRNEVTSPAGTSAAALYYLEKAGMRTAISRAIWGAYERSLELGLDAKSKPPDRK
jgi:pyrroline-5-carboxylate reductase